MPLLGHRYGFGSARQEHERFTFWQVAKVNPYKRMLAFVARTPVKNQIGLVVVSNKHSGGAVTASALVSPNLVARNVPLNELNAP